MSERDNTSALVDGILRLVVGGVFLSTASLIPNMAIALDKPFSAYNNKLDKRAREREVKRVLSYMKRAKLIESQKYEHGIAITKKGRQRLKNADFASLKIPRPKKWDKKWRLVVFDVPESHKLGRNSLSGKLRQLGFKPLQRSVWVYPFACHHEIEAVVLHYKLVNFVTYIETSYIDKPELLKSRFKHLL